MSSLASEYGDVMSLHFGREPWVVLSSPRVVHEAFVRRSPDFSGRPMVPSMLVSSKAQSFARPTLNTELKALRRAAFSSLFDKAQVARANTMLEDEASRLADHLLSGSASHQLRPALRRAVTNMVLRYAFGSPCRVPHSSEGAGSGAHAVAGDDQLLRELVSVVDDIWQSLSATSTFAADLLVDEDTIASAAYYAPLRQKVARRDALLQQLVDRRREGQRATPEPDMLDALLGAGLPDSDVLYTLVDLFVAGVNTVSSTLEWTLLLLAKEPLVQQRARSEVMHLSGSGERCKYTDSVIKEVLRYKPPLLLPRRAVVDSTIGGYSIPAGRVVLANNQALAHSREWWTEPDAFRPERWLLEERSLGTRGEDACKYIPFSIGARVCPGSALAKAELSAVTRTLLTRCRWRGAAGALVDLGEDYSLTLTPARQQALRFERADARAGRRVPRASRTPTQAGADAAVARRVARHPTMTATGRGRATRRQKLELAAEVEGIAERLEEAGNDRRGGWRASKAKGNRRNRRYEKRLLSDVDALEDVKPTEQ